MLARRLGVATPALRRLDSIADTVFYVGATFAVWHLHPSAIRDRFVAIAVLAVLELLRYVFDFVKFGREAAYHMWSSKLWGVALFLALLSLLGFGSDGLIMDAAVYIGIAADLEGLAISAVLRQWQNDVPSLYHAIRLRRNEE